MSSSLTALHVGNATGARDTIYTLHVTRLVRVCSALGGVATIQQVWWAATANEAAWPSAPWINSYVSYDGANSRRDLWATRRADRRTRRSWQWRLWTLEQWEIWDGGVRQPLCWCSKYARTAVVHCFVHTCISKKRRWHYRPCIRVLIIRVCFVMSVCLTSAIM